MQCHCVNCKNQFVLEGNRYHNIFSGSTCLLSRRQETKASFTAKVWPLLLFSLSVHVSQTAPVDRHTLSEM